VGTCPGDEEIAGVNYSYRSPNKSIRVPQQRDATNSANSTNLKKVPAYMMSALLSQKQHFERVFGGFFHSMLSCLVQAQEYPS
jgi:hypothetical protein